MNGYLEVILNFVCIIGIISLVLSFVPKINNFFDIRAILYHHFKIFDGNYLQLFAVYIAPILFSIWIVIRQTVTKDILEEVNLIITILTSMFFAIIGILSSIDLKDKTSKYKKIVEETFNSTLFEIICCLIALLMSFIIIFINNYNHTLSLKIFSTLIYYFIIVIILNVFLLLKRIAMLFEKNLDN